jgi:hypothetical protein
MPVLIHAFAAFPGNLPQPAHDPPDVRSIMAGARPVRVALIVQSTIPPVERIMRDDEGRKVETAVEARAGFLDRPVLVVLCVSLALCVIVFGALWLGLFTPRA